MGALAELRAPEELTIWELPPIGMPDKFGLDIWQQDIDKGVQAVATDCAIARAAKRYFDGATAIYATCSYLEVQVDGVAYYYDSDDLEEFIVGFDENPDLVSPQHMVFTAHPNAAVPI